MNFRTFINQPKWGILLKVIPLTAIFCLTKWFIHQRHWEMGKSDSQIGSLLAAVTFILAFVLTATLNDYRASEDMPDQIVNAVETIQDTNLLIAARQPDYDPTLLTQGLAELLNSVLLCLKQNKPFLRVENAATNLNQLLVPLSKFCEAPLISRIQGEQAKVRLIAARIQRIRDTEFLAPAYPLLHILLIAASVAMLTTFTDDFSTNLLVTGFLFTSFMYLLLLIYDLENPFEYNGTSSADINLSSIEQSYHRLDRG
ncbi:hypothetical protein QUB08_03990 [Microcoleus sp. BR0-C5]|uniref:hypothetical protein n=1 Tax=Microcoleus sp. BR0-C5 TaxID=2818713 RepID=UPI002FD7543E